MKITRIFLLVLFGVLILGCDWNNDTTPSPPKVEYGYGWMDASEEWVLVGTVNNYSLFAHRRSDGVKEHRFFKTEKLMSYRVRVEDVPVDIQKKFNDFLDD
jgi:hypothetical protein